MVIFFSNVNIFNLTYTNKIVCKREQIRVHLRVPEQKHEYEHVNENQNLNLNMYLNE
jgi:hypothetical protein